MADPKRTLPSTPGPLRQYAAPQILIWGSIIWKWIGEMSNIDFLMSIQPQGLREAFQLTLDYGAWLVAVAGVLWWVALSRKWIGRPSWPHTVAAFSFMSFLWGVLIAIEATSEVPRIVTTWGGHELGCKAKLDVARLQKFKKNFDVALMCGIEDANRDRLTDTRISISNKFNIPPNAFEVLAIFNPAMLEVYKQGRPVSTWFWPILVPKDTDMSVIRALSDVKKYGGKIVMPGYFE